MNNTKFKQSIILFKQAKLTTIKQEHNINMTSFIMHSSEKLVNIDESEDLKSNKKIIIKKTVNIYNISRSELILVFQDIKTLKKQHYIIKTALDNEQFSNKDELTEFEDLQTISQSLKKKSQNMILNNTLSIKY